ncbi:kelch-like protein 13 [Lineus longissimus]|uniref:kelch-like protein 13 n=1 Tax=Lineus longissimus TaxID=88925 RepID=UPI002B4EA94D
MAEEERSYGEVVVQGLNSLREDDGHLCDFTVSANEKTFQVHKALLAATCDYFKVMFRGSMNMKESREDSVDLKGLTGTALDHIITFIYTGKLNLNHDTLSDILDAASHLQVHAALDRCTKYLNSLLTFDNADDILEIADTYSLPGVLKEFDTLVLKNFEEFAKTELFFNLKLDHFIKYVSSDELRTRSELQVFHHVRRWIEEDEDRTEHIRDIMKDVRFGLMSEAELQEIAQSDFVRNSSDVSALVSRGLLYHQQSKAGPIKFSDSINTNLRTPSDSLVCVHPGSAYTPLKVTAYQEETNSFFNLTSEFCGNVSAEMAVLDNFIYICRVLDYQNEGGVSTASLCRFDPRHLSLQELQPMERPRTEAALVSLNKKLYLIGGKFANYVILDCIECYDVETNTWTRLDALPCPLHSHAAVVAKENIYISGGWSSLNGHDILPANTFICFNPATRKWDCKPNMLSGPRRLHSMITLQDKIYVFGGICLQNSQPNSEQQSLVPIEVYDIPTDQWTCLSNTLKGRSDGHFVSLNNKIFSIGHEHFKAAEDELWCYDPEKMIWTKIAKAPGLNFQQTKGVIAKINFNDKKLVKITNTR